MTFHSFQRDNFNEWIRMKFNFPGWIQFSLGNCEVICKWHISAHFWTKTYENLLSLTISHSLTKKCTSFHSFLSRSTHFLFILLQFHSLNSPFCFRDIISSIITLLLLWERVEKWNYKKAGRNFVRECTIVRERIFQKVLTAFFN